MQEVGHFLTANHPTVLNAVHIDNSEGCVFRPLFTFNDVHVLTE